MGKCVFNQATGAGSVSQRERRTALVSRRRHAPDGEGWIACQPGLHVWPGTVK
jgi:hypothetical protein